MFAAESGDPYRLLRAFVARAWAISFLKSDRDGGDARRSLEFAQALLPLCAQLDAELLVMLGRGMVDLSQGRFSTAHRHMTDANALAQHLGLRTAIEGTMPIIYGSTSSYWMGRIADQAAELPRLLRLMEDRGNIFGWTSLAGHYVCAISHFPSRHDEAIAVFREITARSSGVGDVIERRWRFLLQVHLALAEGDGARAWAVVTEMWPELERGHLLVPKIVRLAASWAKGRAALAAALAKRPADARLVAEAERAARHIDKMRLGWGRGFDLTLRAGAALVTGDALRASGLLGEAEPLIEALHIHTLLATIREIRGRLIGGSSGAQLHADANTWRVSQELPTLDTVCRIHLPAFR
jgi:hypothetical protein